MSCTHIIKNGTVVNTILATVEEAGNTFQDAILVDASLGGRIGDRYENGQFIKPEPPSKSPEESQEEVIVAAQKRLDDFARTRNYDGILSACTYATSSVSQFAAEGQYAVAARDATWAGLYALMGEVESGARPVPESFADVEPLLPDLVWP